MTAPQFESNEKVDNPSDEAERYEGVLLGLRVLKLFEKQIRKNAVKALFLGTVDSYRAKEERSCEGEGRCGTYTVKFDFGHCEQMSPDGVVACANTFFQCKEGKEQQYPVLASISGSVDTSARRGRQILLAHNNWPLTPSDLEKLEEERKEHLSSYEGTEKPERVEPNWFGALKKAAGPPSDPTQPQNSNNSAASKPLLKRPTSVTFSQGVKESSTTDPLGTLASVSMRFAKEGGDNKPLTRRSLSDEAAELWTRQGNKTSNNNNKNRLKESQADNIIKPPTMQSAQGRRNSSGVENSFPEAGIMANRITVDTAGVPELNEGARPRGLKRPSLSRKVSFGKGVGGDIQGLDPASPEDAMETDQNKRRRGSLSSEVSRALKRQRSYGEAQGVDSGGRQRRPSPINQRKFSVDSAKFSFGDDFDFSVHGDRVPTALRREDRGFSIDSCLSLPPPAIFQRSDRQQSIDTFVSSKSVDSANQPQTPNASGLTPSNIASPGLEPSSAEPMYDIYRQLDHRYVDSPGTKLPALPFQPGSLGDKSAAEGTAMDNEQARATAQANQHPYPSTLNDEQSAAMKGAAAAAMLTRPGGQRQQSLPASHPYHDYSPPQGLQPKSRMQSEPVIRIVSGTQQIQNRPSALQDAGLKQWLSGNSSEGVLPDPMQADSRDQMRPHHAYGQSPYAAYTAAQKAANRQVSCQSGEIQAPSPNHQTPVYRGSGQSFGPQNEKPQPVESMGTRQDPNTLERRHKLVEFGHPYPTVMEGRQLYSRHTLFMCGAHRSDIRLLNSDEEGCDSLLLNGAILLSRKEDLEMFKYRCSLRNGGAALLSNYKKRLPVRIFRQAKDEVSTSYRYDGLYSPIALLDDSGKQQTKVATGVKAATFVFKRNPTGPRAKFSNRMMLEELLGIVQQANSNPGKNPRNDLQIPALTHSGGSLPDYGRGNHPRFPATHMRPDLRGHYPMPPVMDDGVNAAYSSAPPSASHGGKHHHFGRGGGMGPHRSSLQRQTSAEVSLLRIRYFDDPTTTTATTTARGNHHHHHHHHHPGEAAPGSGASTAAPMHAAAMYPMPPAMHPGMHGGTMPAMRHGGVHHPQIHTQMQQPPPTMPPHHAFFPNPNKTLHSHH